MWGMGNHHHHKPMTATISATRRQQLLAESTRRCNTKPGEAYVLAVLADKGGQAFFSASYGDMASCARRLESEGWLAVTGWAQSITGENVIRCTAI